MALVFVHLFLFCLLFVPIVNLSSNTLVAPNVPFAYSFSQFACKMLESVCCFVYYLQHYTLTQNAYTITFVKFRRRSPWCLSEQI